MILIDPDGRDSTLYIRVVTPQVTTSQRDLSEMAKQSQKVMDDNNVGFKVVVTTSGFVKLDPNDVLVDVANDKHPTIARTRAKNPNAEGTNGVGSGQVVVTVDTKTRFPNLTNAGMGNLIVHESLHGAGLSHITHGEKGTLIYPDGSSTTEKELNSTKQNISSKQKSVLENWLKRK